MKNMFFSGRSRYSLMVPMLFAVLMTVTVCTGKSDGTLQRAAGSGRDLGGREIIIGTWYSDYDVTKVNPLSREAERTLEWRTEIQKNHNFRMREAVIASWGQMQELTLTSIMAGDPAASVFVLMPDWAITLYRQNLFYPVSDCPSVDFSSQRPVDWNQNVKNLFTFNGKAYAFSVGYGASLRGNGVFFNKRLFAEAGIDPDLPYDLQKNGTWTWSAFLDICRKLTRDINNDGVIDVYALATFSLDVVAAALTSNNARYIDMDRNGKLVNAAGRPEFLQALQFVVRLNNEGLVMHAPEGANWNWFVTAFRDGQAAMRVAGQHIAGELQSMVDDWGFVFFPRGPRVSTYLIAPEENIFAIPSTFTPQEADDILFAYSLWMTPAPGNEDPELWKYSLYPSYRDPRAVDETVAMFRDPAYHIPVYDSLVPGMDRGPLVWHIWDGGIDPAQLVETASPAWNAAIAKANETN